HKEVRIPLAEVLTISCHSGNWPSLPSWINVWRKPELVLKVYDSAVLAELPAGQHGRGRLRVHPGDLEAAPQLVDGLLRNPLPRPSARFPATAPPVGCPDRVGRQLLSPAIGLLLTAVGALVSTLWLAAVLARQFDPAGDVLAKCLVAAVVFVIMPAGVTLMV